MYVSKSKKKEQKNKTKYISKEMLKNKIYVNE